MPIITKFIKLNMAQYKPSGCHNKAYLRYTAVSTFTFHPTTMKPPAIIRYYICFMAVGETKMHG